MTFGFVSLFADMCYEGMRSISGPYLASLGASALIVGVVTGAGEGIALVLRLVSGSLADRLQRHWTLTMVGYAMTAVCVPLLAVAPKLGGAGLAVASILILLERCGKAIRSPSKSVLLADFTSRVGRGKGFAVHKSLDQIGAFTGPLVIAATTALTASMATGLALLAIPGVLAIALLAWLRRTIEHPEPQTPKAPGITAPLPARFYQFAGAIGAFTAGLMTFGVISFHLVDADMVVPAVVPVIYAAGMAVAALGALGSGWIYDRVGGQVLYSLPVLVSAVVVFAFDDSLVLVLTAIALWALATGIADSTVKALVADLVPRDRLATAYGLFAALGGVAALVGGSLAGWLYQDHRWVLALVLIAAQLAGALLLFMSLRGRNVSNTSPGQLA